MIRILKISGLIIILALVYTCKKSENPPVSLPTLTTTASSSITQATATSGGNISSDGGATVTARGVCWSTSANPTTALTTKTLDGTGTGAFTSSLTGLTANTTYYIRAYATNSVGTAYGPQVSFTTIAAVPVAPTLTTTAASLITQTTATSGGNISSDGGATVTARGVCWSTSANPTTALTTKTSDGTGTGVFTSSLIGLTANTAYYLRAYATNSIGTAYGTQVSFTTSSGGQTGTVTDKDGNVYQTVTIGNQVWMAENLKYLPSVVGPNSFSETTPYYYVYGYNGTNVADAKATANYATYGVLYNWPAAMAGSASSAANPSGVQGVCPAGWHLPSDAEWTTLTTYLGGVNVAGGKLKETGTTHWTSPNTGATNETGFTALPGGLMSGPYDLIGSYGIWWSSEAYSTTVAWAKSVYYDYAGATHADFEKDLGFSVRCVRDF